MTASPVAPAVTAPNEPIGDDAWRTSCLRLCMSLGTVHAAPMEWKDELHKISRAAIELSGFILETDNADQRRRRFHIADLTLQRWPTIAPEEYVRVVRALSCGCVEAVPAGGFTVPGARGAA